MKLPNVIFLNRKTKKQKSMPLVIGFFDGVHKGHLKLFKKTTQNFNILTFINIPSKNKNIFTNASRITNLSFLKSMPKNIYIYDVKQNENINDFNRLLETVVNPSKIVVGNKFKYGKDQKFNVNDLRKIFNVETVSQDNHSSTKIKKMIANGNLNLVNKSLTTPFYYWQGKVVHGKHNGAKLGFKTANIELPNYLILPKAGSYIGFTMVDNKKYESAIFVRNNIVETHLLNGFNHNIYDKRIVVLPLAYFHSTNKAKNFTDLKNIISSKVSEIKHAFESLRRN